MGATLFGFAPGAWAGQTFRLVLVAEGTTRGCVDEGALRQGVASRLGYDPFAVDGRSTILLRLSKSLAGLVGSLEVVGDDNVLRGRRELTTELASCEEMQRAVALSITIAIDAERAGATELQAADALAPVTLETAPEAAPEPTVKRAPEAPVLPLPAPPLPAPPLTFQPRSDREQPSPAAVRREALSAMAGGLVMLGVAPGPAFGVELAAGYHWSRFSVGAGGRVARSIAAEVERGAKLHATLAAAEVEGCLQLRPFELCGLGLLGKTWAGATNVDVPRVDSGLFLAAGGRARLVAAVTPKISALVHAEVLGVAAPIRPEVDGVGVWRAPIVAAGLTAAMRVNFW